MYNQQRNAPQPKALTCPNCKGKRFRVGSGKVVCTNCGWTEKMAPGNKFGAKKTEFDGYKYDSKFEAGIAASLELRKKGKDILDYDKQFKIEAWAHLPDGTPAFSVKHKVDFRIHHKNGSFELIEAKGAVTPDYQMRRQFLEKLWLPLHLDHTYTVVKQ
jgi:hypothetical protein